MKLSESQAEFFRFVTGFARPARSELERLFLGSDLLSAEARVEIYADMYVWRIADGLRQDFVHTARLLGDDGYLDRVRRFLLAHPSEHPSLQWLGRRFPPFLREMAGDLPRPDLPDLADLEWTRTEVFLEADPVPERLETLAAVPPDRFAGTGLTMIPALRLLALDHDAAAVWRKMEDGQAPPSPIDRPTFLVVWRQEFQVFHSLLEAEEHRALQAAIKRKPLATVCQAFAGRENPAEAAMVAIRSWFDEGLVAGVTPSR